MMVKKQTLCDVKGSALEALFSGSYAESCIGEEIFIDRNPLAFSMMIDFIRNSGELHETQNDHIKMLEMELEYWGIDRKIF